MFSLGNSSIASAAQRVQGSLIVESKDGREKDMDDDDDENFLIQEDKTTASKSLVRYELLALFEIYQ